MASSHTRSATTSATVAVTVAPQRCRAPSSTTTNSAPTPHSHGIQSPDAAWATNAAPAAITSAAARRTTRGSTTTTCLDGSPPPCICRTVEVSARTSLVTAARGCVVCVLGFGGCVGGWGAERLWGGGSEGDVRAGLWGVRVVLRRWGSVWGGGDQ